MNQSEEEYSPFLSKEETQREVTKILERDKREEELAKAPKRTWGPPGYRYVKEKGPQTFSFLTKERRRMIQTATSDVNYPVLQYTPKMEYYGEKFNTIFFVDGQEKKVLDMLLEQMLNSYHSEKRKDELVHFSNCLKEYNCRFQVPLD